MLGFWQSWDKQIEEIVNIENWKAEEARKMLGKKRMIASPKRKAA